MSSIFKLIHSDRSFELTTFQPDCSQPQQLLASLVAGARCAAVALVPATLLPMAQAGHRLGSAHKKLHISV